MNKSDEDKKVHTKSATKFALPEHFTTGILNGDDLRFFYYDIGVDNLQRWSCVYDWDSVVEKFKGKLDIDACTSHEIPNDFKLNNIRFTVSNKNEVDNNSKSVAFFRHLRNAFAHYSVVREGENYVLTDIGESGFTMHGFVNAELLKKFCFSFFDIRENIISDNENKNNSTLKYIIK